MFDYHVHTSFSADSKMAMEEACKTALNMNLKEIAFTEHLDYFYPNWDLKWEFDYADYAASVDKMRTMFEELTILKAIEVGIHPYSYEKSKQFTNQNQFDFIIGSVHIVDDLDMHFGEYFKNKTLEQSIELYFQTVNQYVKEYEDFNVLGHLTLIKRYLHFKDAHWKDIDWTKYYDIIEETFKTLIHTNRGIEVNLSGFRYRLDCVLPDLPFIKLYKELGGEIITVGSDAHTKHFVGKHIPYGYELLKEAGFKYVTTFRDRQPIFNKL